MAKSKKRKRKGKSLTTGEPQWTPFQEADIFDGNEEMKAKIMAEEGFGGVYVNSIYQVSVRHVGDSYTWLCIIRKDRKAAHDWRHMQRIKNELVGPDREGVELYPSEERLVDSNNQYHLFVLPEGRAFPFGYMERDVATDVGETKHKQRPFEDRPKDLNQKSRTERLDSPIAVPNWKKIDESIAQEMGVDSESTGADDSQQTQEG